MLVQDSYHAIQSQNLILNVWGILRILYFVVPISNVSWLLKMLYATESRLSLSLSQSLLIQVRMNSLFQTLYLLLTQNILRLNLFLSDPQLSDLILAFVTYNWLKATFQQTLLQNFKVKFEIVFEMLYFSLIADVIT